MNKRKEMDEEGEEKEDWIKTVRIRKWTKRRDGGTRRHVFFPYFIPSNDKCDP